MRFHAVLAILGIGLQIAERPYLGCVRKDSPYCSRCAAHNVDVAANPDRIINNWFGRPRFLIRALLPHSSPVVRSRRI